MSSALTIMAWQEILARIMQGFECQTDVSPDWLVNPATNRRLKLDQLYPEVGLAVRFVGLTAKGQPRQSEWDVLEEAQRNETRAELCRQNGVALFLIDSEHPHPPEQLQTLRTTLSRLSRTLAQSDRPDADKTRYMPLLAEARNRLDEIIRRVRSADDLAQFAELYRDREAAAAIDARPASPPARTPGRPMTWSPGQRVTHARFGPGAVVAVSDAGSDPQITIRFEDDRERTFLASLVGDKIAAP